MVASIAPADGRASADRSGSRSMHRSLGCPGVTVRARRTLCGSARNSRRARLADTRRPAKHAAGRGAAARRRGDARPRVGRPERRVSAGCDGNSGLDEAGTRVEPVPLYCRNVTEVIVAPVGDEARVTHNSDAQPGQRFGAAGRNDAGVLDEVTCWACLLQRSNGEQQLLSSDTVHGDRAAGVVDAGNGASEFVGTRQRYIVQHQFLRPERHSRAVRFGQARRSHQDQALRNHARFGQLRELGDISLVSTRGRVGEAGDAGLRCRGGILAQAGRKGASLMRSWQGGEPMSQPVVQPQQPACGRAANPPD